MATTQNVIKAKSKSNQQAHVRERFGSDVVELFEEETNDDWRDVQEFSKYIDLDD